VTQKHDLVALAEKFEQLAPAQKLTVAMAMIEKDMDLAIVMLQRALGELRLAQMLKHA